MLKTDVYSPLGTIYDYYMEALDLLITNDFRRTGRVLKEIREGNFIDYTDVIARTKIGRIKALEHVAELLKQELNKHNHRPIKKSPEDEDEGLWRGKFLQITPVGHIELVRAKRENIEYKTRKEGDGSYINTYAKHMFVYNYIQDILTFDDVKKALLELQKLNKKIKVNFSFGFVCISEDKDLKKIVSIFTPAFGGMDMYFTDLETETATYKLIENRRDIPKIIEEISVSRIVDLCFTPGSTKWTPIGIVDIYIKYLDLGEPIGCAFNIELHPHIIGNQHLVSLSKDKTKLCLFNCLAIYKGCRYDRYLSVSKSYYQDFYRSIATGKSVDIIYTPEYKGFNPLDLEKFEDFFKINVDIYQFNEDESLTFIRVSKKEYSETLMLGQVEEHYYLIKDIAALTSTYICPKCRQSWHRLNNLKRHIPKCGTFQKEIFPKNSTVYRPSRNLIIDFNEKFGTNIPFLYPFVIVYDWEVDFISSSVKTKKEDSSTIYTKTHLPLCFAISSNIPGCGTEFVCLTDIRKDISMDERVKLLVRCFKSKIKRFAVEAYKIVKKYQDVIENRLEIEKSSNFSMYNRNTNSKILEYFKTIPVVGFNSGKYDLNVIKRFDFLEPDNIKFVIKKGQNFMTLLEKFDIKKNELYLSWCDVTNYLAPGYSLRQYLESYKEEAKGYFPYEWMNGDLEKLKEKELPPRAAFHSRLKNSNITEDQYRYCQKMWVDNKMETMKDFLKWYQCLDVSPLCSAILKNKLFYSKFKLDMFADSYSVPGLSEKIAYHFAIDKKFEDRACSFSRESPQKVVLSLERKEKELPDLQEILKKIKHYKKQDKARNRSLLNYITPNDIIQLFKRNSSCYYCDTHLSKNNWTLDRIFNKKSHTSNNVKLACVNCNRDRPYNSSIISWRKIKQLDKFSDTYPLIKLIDEKNRAVFDLLRKNIVGGPAIIFHRYHEKDKTNIQRYQWVNTSGVKSEKNERGSFKLIQPGKKVAKILGFDANALYLYCLMQQMPCGSLFIENFEGSKEEFLNTVKEGKWFGFVECDIQVPEKLYDYFSEFPPIFKNCEVPIKQEIIGEYTYNLMKKLKYKAMESRKLISSFKGCKILLYTPLLKWYFEHGLVVSKIYRIIKAIPNKIFKDFGDYISDARRTGDRDDSKMIFAETCKLQGNSCIGRSIMNKYRHSNIKYITKEEKVKRMANKASTQDINIIRSTEPVFECKQQKAKIRQNLPIQVGCCIYQLAKLRMLEFYYDCIDKYISREDYQIIEMDTDSLYMAITAEKIESLVKSELLSDFLANKNKFFPNEKNLAFDKRTPGLFKIEKSGTRMLALSPKIYYIDNHTQEAIVSSKISCKGTQKDKNRAILTFKSFKSVLTQGIIQKSKNIGFRVRDNQMVTYEQNKNGLTPLYNKRMVFSDGITTCPLLI